MEGSLSYRLCLDHILPLPDNFMARLTSDGVVEHIERCREAVRRWARNEKEFVARFEEEQKKLLASKRSGNR